jgi:hypothetical protein
LGVRKQPYPCRPLVFTWNDQNKNKISYLGGYNNSIDQNTARANVLARLISMPIQLKDLRVGEFEWLLHIVQYVSILNSKIELHLKG